MGNRTGECVFFIRRSSDWKLLTLHSHGIPNRSGTSFILTHLIPIFIISLFRFASISISYTQDPMLLTYISFLLLSPPSNSNSSFLIAAVEISLLTALHLNGNYCEFLSPPFPPSLLSDFTTVHFTLLIFKINIFFLKN